MQMFVMANAVKQSVSFREEVFKLHFIIPTNYFTASAMTELIIFKKP